MNNGQGGVIGAYLCSSGDQDALGFGRHLASAVSGVYEVIASSFRVVRDEETAG